MGYGMNSTYTPSVSGSGKTGTKVPKGYSLGQTQEFTPEQMQLFQQQFSHLGPDSYTSRLASGDQGMFAEMEAPALRQFSGIQGNIASRFSGGGGGQGSMSSRRSSGFQNTMNAASSDFAQDLQSKRQTMQQQAIRDLMGYSNQILNQRPYEQQFAEKPTPFWQELTLAGVNAAGQTASAMAGK